MWDIILTLLGTFLFLSSSLRKVSPKKRDRGKFILLNGLRPETRSEMQRKREELNLFWHLSLINSSSLAKSLQGLVRSSGSRSSDVQFWCSFPLFVQLSAQNLQVIKTTSHCRKNPIPLYFIRALVGVVSFTRSLHGVLVVSVASPGYYKLRRKKI